MVGKKKVTLVSTIIVLAAVAIFYTYVNGLLNSVLYGKEVARESVENLYELANPGVTAEVVTMQEDSGLYKVLVKLSTPGSSPTYAEAWVTKDGKIFTQNVILAEESVKQMQSLRDFVSCLDEKGVRIVGTLNQTLSPAGAQATLLQLNILGANSPNIYVSCDANLQACLDAGVTQVPAIVYGETIIPGFQEIASLENISGCSLAQ